MKVPFQGAIDCDMHPAVPATSALLPYLNEFWRDHLVNRHIDRNAFTLSSYAPNLPIAGRPDWRPAKGLPGSDFAMLQKQALDTFGTRYAICNVLHGALGLYNADMAAALIGAVNDWVVKELLDRDPRLRASILVAPQNIDNAVKEIERHAHDRRFVQVMLLAMQDKPLGHRQFWPIYQAAEKHDLMIGVHAGSIFRHSPTGSGWPSYHIEDYVAQGPGAEDVIVSFLAEGVFQKFPKLKLIMMETGFTWLPTLLWRNNKVWRGVRTEVPWIDRPPADIVREHVRFTLQPVDAPKDSKLLLRTLEHIGSDKLILFSTDYPHWQFDGEDALPDGLSDEMIRRILVDNPLETYPRLNDAAGAGTGAKAEETVP